MRKHRLYGFVLAVLTATGVSAQQLTQAHAATIADKSSNPSTGTTRSWSTPSFLPVFTRSITFPVSNRLFISGGALSGVSPRHHRSAFDQAVAAALEGERSQREQMIDDYLTAVEMQRYLQAVQAQELVNLVAAEQAAALAQQQAAAQQAAALAAQLAARQQAPAPVAQGGGAGGAWAALRACESGGNYAENSGNGYYGAYQFSESTWSSLGYSGLPSAAPPAVQDQAAQTLQARSGWGQWPVCSVKIGL